MKGQTDNQFQKPEEWNGNPTDMNYAPIPEDKAESKAEIKKALEETITASNERFGLNEMGMEPIEEDSNKKTE